MEFKIPWTGLKNRAIFLWPWNENARTKQKQLTNRNRVIWLVYRTDTNARGLWLVKRTLGWKKIMPKNFLEINRYFALTSYCNTTGQLNNAFSIWGFSLAGKRGVHVLIFSSIGWWNTRYRNYFSRSYENCSVDSKAQQESAIYLLFESQMIDNWILNLITICSKKKGITCNDQGRVVRSWVKITPGYCKISPQIWELKKANSV